MVCLREITCAQAFSWEAHVWEWPLPHCGVSAKSNFQEPLRSTSYNPLQSLEYANFLQFPLLCLLWLVKFQTIPKWGYSDQEIASAPKLQENFSSSCYHAIHLLHCLVDVRHIFPLDTVWVFESAIWTARPKFQTFMLGETNSASCTHIGYLQVKLNNFRVIWQDSYLLLWLLKKLFTLGHYSMAPPGIEPSSQERNFTGSLIRIFLECTGTLQRHTICTTYLILKFLGSWSSSKTIRERPTCRHTTRYRTWISRIFRSQYSPQESWVYLSISVEKRSNKETKICEVK